MRSHRFLIALAAFAIVTIPAIGTAQQAADAPDRESTSDSIGKTVEVAEAQVSLIQNTFVAAPIAGAVSEVLVAEGDRVDVGHRMVQLDAQQATTELEAARAAYAAARMQADNDVDARYAQRTLEVRQRELQQSVDANRGFAGAISDTEIAKLQLVVDQSRLAIEQAEHELSVARANAEEKLAASRIVEARFEKHAVKAPVSGSVVEVVVEPGEWVEAGKPIVRVISLDPIRVECFVDGRAYGSELVGRSVEFYPASAGSAAGANGKTKPLVGRVTFVSPELHPVTGQARLWATIANGQRLARAGMQGRLVIRP